MALASASSWPEKEMLVGVRGRAIEPYEHERLDFAETYLAAAAEVSGVGAVASLDRTLDCVDGIERMHQS